MPFTLTPSIASDETPGIGRYFLVKNRRVPVPAVCVLLVANWDGVRSQPPSWRLGLKARRPSGAPGLEAWPSEMPVRFVLFLAPLRCICLHGCTPPAAQVGLDSSHT